VPPPVYGYVLPVPAYGYVLPGMQGEASAKLEAILFGR